MQDRTCGIVKDIRYTLNTDFQAVSRGNSFLTAFFYNARHHFWNIDRPARRSLKHNLHEKIPSIWFPCVFSFSARASWNSSFVSGLIVS
jgi:hypothetical protein